MISTSELNVEKCPACESSNYSIWMQDGKNTRYVKCKTCGSIYANPKASWANRYSWLDDQFKYGSNALKNAKGRQEGLRFEAEIIKNLCNSGTILDIGCDLGDLFSFFDQTVWNFHGVEISPSASEYARQHYPAEIHTGLLNQTHYSINNFDVVTMLDTIYYVDDPLSDFKKIYRILKPGGLFIIDIPGLKYQMLRSRGLLCWLIDKKWTRLQTDSSYVCWFSVKGITKLLSKTGFAIDQLQPIPSPSVNRNRIYKLASGLYYKYSKFSVKSSFEWSPKYLIVGRKP